MSKCLLKLCLLSLLLTMKTSLYILQIRIRLKLLSLRCFLPLPRSLLFHSFWKNFRYFTSNQRIPFLLSLWYVDELLPSKKKYLFTLNLRFLCKLYGINIITTFCPYTENYFCFLVLVNIFIIIQQQSLIIKRRHWVRLKTKSRDKLLTKRSRSITLLL